MKRGGESRGPRVAYLVTHPIQYQAPFLRYLASTAALDLEVVYLSDYSARGFRDRWFGDDVRWGVPLLEGYRSRALTHAPRVGRLRPFPRSGLRAVLAEGFDALWVHGWSQAAHLFAIECAHRAGLPVLLRGESRPGRRGLLRRRALAWLVDRAQAFLAIGSSNRAFWRQQGVRDERLFDVPYAIDQETFRRRAAEAAPRRSELRRELGLDERPIVLFVGKLYDVKRPFDLLAAQAVLAAAGGPTPQVLFAGDGPLRGELERRAAGPAGRDVRFLGFCDQSELPALYDLCDVLCLPSERETFGLVLCEAMAVGRPVVTTTGVGAAADLVLPDQTGCVVPVGDPPALARALADVCGDRVRARAMGRRARAHAASWSFEAGARGLLQALDAVGAGSRSEAA